MSVSAPSLQKTMKSMNILDRVWLNYIYQECADLIELDGLVSPQLFEATRSIKQLHGCVLNYVWDGMKDTSPLDWAGLAVSMTESLSPLLGDGSLPITPERRKALAKFFSDTAWSGLGRG